MPTTQIEVLYNGVCPVCRAGACDLERKATAARAGVIFTDVAANPDSLGRAGVTLDAVRLKLHALTTPPFSWLAAGVYHVTAHVLWAWNRAFGRW